MFRGRQLSWLPIWSPVKEANSGKGYTLEEIICSQEGRLSFRSSRLSREAKLFLNSFASVFFLLNKTGRKISYNTDLRFNPLGILKYCANDSRVPRNSLCRWASKGLSRSFNDFILNRLVRCSAKLFFAVSLLYFDISAFCVVECARKEKQICLFISVEIKSLAKVKKQFYLFIYLYEII